VQKTFIGGYRFGYTGQEIINRSLQAVNNKSFYMKSICTIIQPAFCHFIRLPPFHHFSGAVQKMINQTNMAAVSAFIH
jgi:hypothetical protein